jgi:hypothetical protein
MGQARACWTSNVFEIKPKGLECVPKKHQSKINFLAG